jgi:hypothetical protein
MKRIFNYANHGIVDLVVIALLAICPTAFKFSGNAGITAYAFAMVFLILGLCTSHRFGLVKRISFPVHGMIEFYIGWALILVALFVFRGNERLVLTGIGFVSFIAFLSTDFDEPVRARSTSRKAA